ncbi:hypothetical protein A4X13_0g2426 [Tilletia indica]|uniref:Nascent polypeptide-associated complex subunit beta n=2 Tax=Tilletia TaxID=13289 RepID=A0A177TV16_9BASI|nr:hypothetical protein A4X13_0g2426 [Tilletia indica]
MWSKTSTATSSSSSSKAPTPQQQKTPVKANHSSHLSQLTKVRVSLFPYPTAMPVNPEALARLQAANRVGGKGTPRRKVVKKKGPGGDDTKLQTALKKLNVMPMAGIEEVNMFKEDGNVLHFQQPKVHGVNSANTFAIYGRGADKELTDLVPSILSQLGPESLASLRKLAESYQAMSAQHGAAQGGAGGADGKDDDDVPDVVEDFDVEEGKEDDKAAEADVDKLD